MARCLLAIDVVIASRLSGFASTLGRGVGVDHLLAAVPAMAPNQLSRLSMALLCRSHLFGWAWLCQTATMVLFIGLHSTYLHSTAGRFRRMMQSTHPWSSFPRPGAPRINKTVCVFRSGKPAFSLHQGSNHFSFSATSFRQRIQPYSLGEEDNEGFRCVDWNSNIAVKIDPACEYVRIEWNRAGCLCSYHVAVAIYYEIHEASDDILMAMKEKSAVELEGHWIRGGAFLLRGDLKLDQAGFEFVFLHC